MFTQFIKIKPTVDRVAAKKAEETLSKRFGRVATRFGKGLEKVMKGNILFLSLGLVANLLNPLKAVEERIKNLMGQGTDLKEIADNFGTTPGQLQRLQDVAQNRGLSPDRLYSMMESFTSAVERAREEEANRKKTGEPISDASRMVKDWIGETDMAEAFFSFIRSMRATSDEVRAKAEKEILGGVQRGAGKNFINSHFPLEFSRLGTPGVERTNNAVNKLSSLAEQDRRLTTSRETTNMVASAEGINSDMITAMNKSVNAERERERQQMKSFDDLAKAREGIDEITKILSSTATLVAKGVGYLGDLVGYIKNSRFMKGLTGGGY